MKTRLYDSELGRFLSKDQTLNGNTPLSLNPYLYCANNPVDRIDPSGKSWWSAVTKFASSVVQTVKAAVTAVVNTVKQVAKTVYNYVNTTRNKVKSFINTKIVTPIATGPVGAFAEWATANPYRLAGVSIAIGIACVGGYLGVQAAISYAAGLGTYGAASAASGGGAGYKTYNEAKNALGSPGAGNQWHHIVEQSQVMKSGFSSSMVNNTSNLVAVPARVHAQISGFYNSSPDFASGMRVRDWLAGQNFQQQYDFGIQVMKSFGVIQ